MKKLHYFIRYSCFQSLLGFTGLIVGAVIGAAFVSLMLGGLNWALGDECHGPYMPIDSVTINQMRYVKEPRP